MGGFSNGGLCTYICCHMSGLWLYISSPESRHLVPKIPRAMPSGAKLLVGSPLVVRSRGRCQTKRDSRKDLNSKAGGGLCLSGSLQRLQRWKKAAAEI